MIGSPLRLRLALMALALSMLLAGCNQPIDTSPGRSRNLSINGTGTFAELLRQRGHEVRAARRATEKVADWANVIVRFSLNPGLPDREEGDWLVDWLEAQPGRKLVYVVHDFDGESEFWDAVLASLPKDASESWSEQVKRNRDKARSWVGELPPKAKQPADKDEWFSINPKPGLPTTCKTLDGPWAEGVDAHRAAITRPETFEVESDEPILLSGDGLPLAITWTFENGNQALALANGSFLLNEALLNHARRPLAMRLADWIGNPPLHVAFIEGASPMSGESESNSPFRLIHTPPFNFVSPHILGFLLLLALSYAVRLGRPRPEPPSGVERPSAHPEAIGALLAKTRRADTARFLIDAYRRWRSPSQGSGRKAPSPPPPS